MIPIRLEISNFLSYQERAELDFAGINTACISGRNGAGKSSILDALTWVLFGKSRGRSDDDVVNRRAARDKGQAEVRLEFALEGTVYRVIRRKKVGRSASLELQIAGDDGWVPLTESKVRETQAAIESLLRMNYDTFINASFLLQGKADEFTTKTPNQRKIILADLLGVSLWERYREQAITARRGVEQTRLLKGDRLEAIAAELAERPEREAAHAAAVELLNSLTIQLQTQESLLNEVRKTDAVIKQQRSQLERLRDSLEQNESRLADLKEQKAARQAEKAGHQALLARREAILEAFAAWEAAGITAREWQEKANRSHGLQNLLAPLRSKIEAEQSRLEERRRYLTTKADKMAGQAERIAAATATLARIRSELDGLQARRAAIAEQEEAWLAAQSELQRLQNERAEQTRQLNELRRREATIAQQEVEQKKLSVRLAELEASVQRQQGELAAAEADRRTLADLRAELARCEAEQPALKEEMDKMKARMDQLLGETGKSCPLCGQPLTADHLARVLAEIKAEGKQKGDAYRANRDRIQDLRQAVGRLEKQSHALAAVETSLAGKKREIQDLSLQQRGLEQAIAQWGESGAPGLKALAAALADDQALRDQEAAVAALADIGQLRDAFATELRQLQGRQAAQESSLTSLQAELQQWQEQEEPELARTSAQLAKQNFAAAERESLATLEKELSEVGYDGKAHQSANEALAQLEKAPQEHQELLRAETSVKHLDELLSSLEQRLDEVLGQQKSWQVEVVGLEQSLATLTADGEADLDKLEDEVFSLREGHQKARADCAVEESRLASLKQQETKHKTLIDEISELDRRIGQIKELERAFGRNGVQALLIEQAMPDLENRANRLLERLSDGEMTISFQTQRKLKSRDELAETLDIHINDTAGERPYENYSGGEQFRVNFAVRLALSQLLAQRSGARLQTLVIDEGFGSQDPAGRQRLVEAINTIQDDFERILIITHIDELKDAFPTHIEVEKTIAGSTIRVF